MPPMDYEDLDWPVAEWRTRRLNHWLPKHYWQIAPESPAPLPHYLHSLNVQRQVWQCLALQPNNRQCKDYLSEESSSLWTMHSAFIDNTMQFVSWITIPLKILHLMTWQMPPQPCRLTLQLTSTTHIPTSLHFYSENGIGTTVKRNHSQASRIFSR